MDDELCEACGQNRTWHAEHHPRHMFTAPGERIKLPSDKEAAKVNSTKAPAPPSSAEDVLRSMGVDVVLRATLVRCGIIKPEDLQETERVFLEALQGGERVVIFKDESGGQADVDGGGLPGDDRQDDQGSGPDKDAQRDGRANHPSNHCPS